MNKKMLIVVVLALVVAGGAYKTVLAKPSKPAPEPKVHGTVYVLPKEFLVNLADGRYAKVSVALVVEAAEAAGGHGGGHGAPTPPEGYGSEPQEAIVRDLITDTLTDAGDADLIEREGREKLKKKILKAIKKHTDVHVEEVLFPDVTVQ
ncbi:MAG TPA: flagellar basal body-associated FliL family protein [Solirubrobacteraceae bacterium]|nr:flagellar basal body-associated FliL family protein [Solirubrobacteraceae bacterium]